MAEDSSICPRCGASKVACSAGDCAGYRHFQRSVSAMEERKRRKQVAAETGFLDMEEAADMAARHGFELIEQDGKWGLFKHGRPFISPKEGHDRKLLIRCAWFWASEEVWKHQP